MITRCPSCHFMVIAEHGCSNCGYTDFSKEVNDQGEEIGSQGNEGNPAGEEIISPAGQLELPMS